MEMQQVRYFVTLARELNFTRAAEACNVSQPALTRAIQSLEAELGGPLFHRERAQTHLSELGRMMAPYFEAILQKVDGAKREAQAFAQLDHVELKLGAMCTIGPKVVSDFIVRFYGQNEGLNLVVTDATPSQLPEQLIAGELEVALYGSPEPLDERLHALPLFSERYMAVLPAGHRLAMKNMISVKDLQGEPYCCRINCEMGDEADKAFDAQGVTNPVVFSSERDDWVLGMISAGVGWGFFPEFCTFPPDVAARPLVEPMFERTISLVTVRGRPHSPGVGAFVRGARTHAWPKAA
jgi:DNA-binding transcriptional LysR family regulator